MSDCKARFSLVRQAERKKDASDIGNSFYHGRMQRVWIFLSRGNEAGNVVFKRSGKNYGIAAK